MRGRFLLLSWGPHGRSEAMRVVAALPDWSSKVGGRDWMLLTPDPEGPVEVEGAWIVGSIFPRTSEPPGPHPGRADAERPVERLMRRQWGAYVAIVDQRHHVEIFRDPSGGLPAYWTHQGDLTLVLSGLEEVVAAGAIVSRIDWSSVAGMIAYPQVRADRTGLEGVHELLPGQTLRIRLGGPEGLALRWSPWRFAARSAAILDRSRATEMLRHTVQSCVAAWADRFPRPLLELSGGLDSSIIAASLRLAGHSVDCINIVTPTAEGDEQRFARLAAEGHRLRIVPVVAKGVDIRRARAGRLPRPGAHALLRPIEDAFVAAARASGATAFFSGLGGDNVFCSLSSAAPASDALLTSGPGPRFMRALDDLGRLHGCTAWTAGGLALRKAARSGSMGRLPADATFLTPGRAPDQAPYHPWMSAPRGALPGKHDQVRSLLLAQAYLDRYEHAAEGEIVFPLLSQPIVELCLRIPTWLWIADGQNRAIARDAFASALPEAVVRRRSKGGLNAFVAAVFEDNVEGLRAQLIKGRLAQAGLLDISAVREVLANPALASGQALFRVLQLADVEAWARTWDDP